MPRAFSSGALSISSNFFAAARPLRCSVVQIAAVSVVCRGHVADRADVGFCKILQVCFEFLHKINKTETTIFVDAGVKKRKRY